MSEPWGDSSALAHTDLPTVHILILSSLQAVSPFYSAFISLQGLFLETRDFWSLQGAPSFLCRWWM